MSTRRDGKGRFPRRDGTAECNGRDFLGGKGRYKSTVGETVNGTGPRIHFDDSFTIPSCPVVTVVTVNTVTSINHENLRKIRLASYRGMVYRKSEWRVLFSYSKNPLATREASDVASVLPGAPRLPAGSFCRHRLGGYRSWDFFGGLAQPRSPALAAATGTQRSNF